MVLGAGGQLGRTLVQTLKGTEPEEDVLGFTHHQADITNASQIEYLVQKFSPDQIVNAAAWTDVPSAESNIVMASKVNTQGAVNVAIAARNSGSSLIHISTDYVFSGNQLTPIAENYPQDPLNMYGQTKAAAEKLLTKDFRDSVVIIRTAWLYGPNGRNFARTIIGKAIQNKHEDIQVVNDQWGQPTSTLDLADKIVEIGNKGIKSGIFHGTNAGKTNWYEFARFLFESAGLNSSRIKPVSSSNFSTQVNRPIYSVLGHKGWEGSGILPMRDWKLPANELAKILRSEVENGLQ